MNLSLSVKAKVAGRLLIASCSGKPDSSSSEPSVCTCALLSWTGYCRKCGGLDRAGESKLKELLFSSE